MIRHYLTFSHQARVIDEAVRGMTLAECWSQEKHQMLLRFIEGTESTFVELAVGLQLGYALVKKEAHRARKNTIDFFESMLGARLREVTIDDGERLIRFRFTDGRELVVAFFGGGSGNILVVQEGRVIDSFQRDEGAYDAILRGGEERPARGRDEIRALLRAADAVPHRALASAIPELGRRLAVEALYRAGLADAPSLRDLPDESLDRLLDEADRLYAECDEPEIFYLYHLPDEPVFALTALGSVQGLADRVERFEEIDRAVRAYRGAMMRETKFSEIETRLRKRIGAELARLDRALAKGLSEEERGSRADEWEKVGQLILANLDAIRKGDERVVLDDWEGNLREVELDPKLTPQQNAERYFSRSRVARESARQSTGRRVNLASRRERFAVLAAAVERAETVADLETIEATNRDLLKMKDETKGPEPSSRFRRFEVAEGHEVYVGRNAANNDELTVRFARPNDYWFHARGVSGSHVVLRWGSADSKPPKEAVRQAASIAAYYSGARNAKMVPVAYTPKKYVRKPKGAAPGAVVMERENVVMVEPKLPPGSSE